MCIFNEAIGIIKDNECGEKRTDLTLYSYFFEDFIYLRERERA